MSDNDYCENCGGKCDGCCGGSNKKFPTKEEQVEGLVKTIMSYGLPIANLVLSELRKQIQEYINDKNKKK